MVGFPASHVSFRGRKPHLKSGPSFDNPYLILQPSPLEDALHHVIGMFILCKLIRCFHDRLQHLRNVLEIASDWTKLWEAINKQSKWKRRDLAFIPYFKIDFLLLLLLVHPSSNSAPIKLAKCLLVENHDPPHLDDGDFTVKDPDKQTQNHQNMNPSHNSLKVVGWFDSHKCVMPSLQLLVQQHESQSPPCWACSQPPSGSRDFHWYLPDNKKPMAGEVTFYYWKMDGWRHFTSTKGLWTWWLLWMVKISKYNFCSFLAGPTPKTWEVPRKLQHRGAIWWTAKNGHTRFLNLRSIYL